mmetsp:Transcript_21062/g.33702  ORF Transcript_21062/g.33702 Transcript_21062/m.33702 type:complete len:261 (-) Transcript_21062:36-818(-)
MTTIIEIWNENFNESLLRIKILLKECQYVAMDTEFPGTVIRFFENPLKSQDYYFHTLRINVDSLKLIQLGISFGNDTTGSIKIKTCLQFNFKFSLSEEMFAQDSIDLLLRSGVDFECHKKKGISLEIFTNMLKKSGLIFNEKIYWISFHSGYDFGYLIKILTKKKLPKNIKEFLKILQFFFPNFYDVKYLNLFCGNFKRGLNKLAEKLQINRIGQVHQAGSDSVLTLSVFNALKRVYFSGKIDKKFEGLLFGLNDIKKEN